LPDTPGVYLFRNCREEILYVGKSVKLKTRVRSYFRKAGGHSRPTQRLKFEASTVEIAATGSELAALILENRLIKKYLPPFNRLQRRYQHYPFLRLTVQEPFPRLHLTRSLENDGAEYYGPYVKAGLVGWMANLLNEALGLRTCKDLSAIHQGCLLDQLGKCLAPCRGWVQEEAYQVPIEQLRAMLQGETSAAESILQHFRDQMQSCAAQEAFERAAQWRNRLFALESFLQRQNLVRERVVLDLAMVYVGPHRGTAQVFWVQSGTLLTTHEFNHTESIGTMDKRLKSFYEKNYALSNEQPCFTLPQDRLDEVQMLSSWIYRHRAEGDLFWLNREDQDLTGLRELIRKTLTLAAPFVC
ncbi:MAG: GIY-YIG nuclease family protein, partial [Gloeobacterales cyanobacterium]